MQMWYLLHFCCSLVTHVNPFFRPVLLTVKENLGREAAVEEDVLV